MNGFPKILYDNRLADAAPVASSTAAGAEYHVLNLRDWKPFTFWKPAALPATITVNCGAARSADYAAFFAHNFFTGGNTVEIRHSTDNFAANDVVAATITPGNNKDFFATFAAISRQYWRIRIANGVAPTLAIAAIGAALDFPRRPQQGFGPVNRRVVGQFNVTEGGHPIENVKAFSEWRQDVQFRAVDQAWVRNTLLPAWDAHLENKPFGFAWDPVDHATELYLCTADNALPTPHGTGQHCNVQLGLRARVN